MFAQTSYALRPGFGAVPIGPRRDALLSYGRPGLGIVQPAPRRDVLYTYGRPGLGQLLAGTDPFSNVINGIYDAVSNFGVLEWAVIIGGAFVLYSVVSTTSRGVRGVRSSLSARRAKASKRRKLEQELSEL